MQPDQQSLLYTRRYWLFCFPFEILNQRCHISCVNNLICKTWWWNVSSSSFVNLLIFSLHNSSLWFSGCCYIVCRIKCYSLSFKENNVTCARIYVYLYINLERTGVGSGKEVVEKIKLRRMKEGKSVKSRMETIQCGTSISGCSLQAEESWRLPSSLSTDSSCGPARERTSKNQLLDGGRSVLLIWLMVTWRSKFVYGTGC